MCAENPFRKQVNVVLNFLICTAHQEVPESCLLRLCVWQALFTMHPQSYEKASTQTPLRSSPENTERFHSFPDIPKSMKIRLPLSAWALPSAESQVKGNRLSSLWNPLNFFGEGGREVVKPWQFVENRTQITQGSGRMEEFPVKAGVFTSTWRTLHQAA